MSDKADHRASLRVSVSDMRALVSERTRKPSGITVSQASFLKTLELETLAEVRIVK